MRVLFDQNIPVPLRDSLGSHDVSTAHEMGWSTLENGRLLNAAVERGFDVFITADKNLRYQQNLKDHSIAILVLSTTSWPRIRSSISQVLNGLDLVVSSDFIEVEIVSSRK